MDGAPRYKDLYGTTYADSAYGTESTLTGEIQALIDDLLQPKF